MERNVFLAEDIENSSLLKETLDKCILDSGCTKTVCGEKWLVNYLETLSHKDKEKVMYTDDTSSFRFGVGKAYPSKTLANIPIFINNEQVMLKTSIIEADIPLLLSRYSLKKADAHIDFSTDTLHILGSNTPLCFTESGHYCISLNKPTFESMQDLFLTSPLQNDTPDGIRQKVLKLHKQFAHPYPNRLKKLVKDSGIDDENINKVIDEISNNCETCQKFRVTPPKPSVTFPLASKFNETVAMDLKEMQNKYILHLIDHATRYAAAAVIPNKKKETIVKGILEYWVRIFGSAGKFLFDNVGEFVNKDVTDFAESFNINIATTAAESPWSNGLVERHNGILADAINKTVQGSNCTLEMAVHWAICAKNSLLNVHGFSPNQLVFGMNPNFPNVHTDKPPAGNHLETSEYLTANLNAMHTARQAFIRQESCERLRRALNTKTRNAPFFINGDLVYYKRNNSREWHGPAKVLGKDSQNYLLKHGGQYIRVHPCRLQSCSDDTHISKEKESSSETETDLGQQAQTQSSSTNPDQIEGTDSSSDESTDDQMHDHVGQNIIPNQDNQQPTAKPPLALRRLADFNCPPSNPDDVFLATKDRFHQEKLDEIVKWREMDTFEEVIDTGQHPRISTKWVCTEKQKGGKLVTKARLVARGFEETDPQIRTDSPTCSKSSLRLILSILVSFSWPLHTLDVKSAFLQGMPINRDIFLIPPKIAQIKGLWKLKKCAYGLVDAGRQWYIKVFLSLKKLNGKQLSLDPGVFFWKIDGRLIGIMAFHVDDFIYGGNTYFHNTIIAKIKSVLTVGIEETISVKFLGLHMEEHKSEIILHTNPYIQSIEEIPSSKLGNKDSPLSSEQVSSLRHTVGQLNWISSQTRPDIAFDNCVIGSCISKATVDLIHKTNKAIRKAKTNDMTLRFPLKFDITKSKIIAFSDASFANLNNRASQGANIILLIDSSGFYCPITWRSHRLKRVVSSTLAAECLAAVEASETCSFIQNMIAELLDIKPSIGLLTDSKSLVDTAHSTTTVESKRLQIEVSVLRDTIHRGELNEFRWIPTELNLANPLTKAGANTKELVRVLGSQLKYDFSTAKFVESD